MKLTKFGGRCRRRVNYNELDPGVRETVRRLNDWGFETTDSGDGITKIEAGQSTDEVLDRPHVFIRCKPQELCLMADRLMRELTRAGFCVEPCHTSSIWIECTYDPADGVAMIMLFGVIDAGWAP